MAGLAQDLPEVSLPALLADGRDGVEQAVRHLVKQGHRRVAFGDGGPPLPCARARWRASSAPASAGEGSRVPSASRMRCVCPSSSALGGQGAPREQLSGAGNLSGSRFKSPRAHIIPGQEPESTPRPAG